MAEENKHHWYDGLFYDKIIAPNQDKAYRIVKKIIEPDSTLLDVGCGTGRLGFQLANHCSKIDGVDLSFKNISTANNKLQKKKINNLNFYHYDILKYLDDNNSIYDYSVLSYMIHEIDVKLRENILHAVSRVSEKIILIDYLHPKPKNISGKLISVVEFLAGRDHNKNFKSYMKNNGLEGLAKSSGLEIIKEIRKKESGTHIAVMAKN